MATRNINDLIATQKVGNANYSLENGQLVITTGTITTSKPAVSATQTWNAIGETFVLDSMNVTDTASAAASLLWERKHNSQRKHQFTKTGLEIFNSWTSDSVYERGFMRWVSNVLEIGTEHVGAAARGLALKVGGVSYITVSSTGAIALAGNTALPGAVSGNGWYALGGASGQGVTFGNSLGIHWGPNAAYATYDNGDIGLGRASAGVAKVTNGSSGYGQLIFVLPPADPGVAGAPWNNAGTIAISAG